MITQLQKSNVCRELIFLCAYVMKENEVEAVSITMYVCEYNIYNVSHLTLFIAYINN